MVATCLFRTPIKGGTLYSLDPFIHYMSSITTYSRECFLCSGDARLIDGEITRGAELRGKAQPSLSQGPGALSGLGLAAENLWAHRSIYTEL